MALGLRDDDLHLGDADGHALFGPMAEKVRIEFTILAAGALLVLGGTLILWDRTIRHGELAPVSESE